jgi:hypothetical protein
MREIRPSGSMSGRWKRSLTPPRHLSTLPWGKHQQRADACASTARQENALVTGKRAEQQLPKTRTKHRPRRPGPLGQPAAWDRRFRGLTAFQKEHGQCDAPGSYPPNQPRGNWAASVRRRKKQGMLPRQIVRCLDGLGFRWSPIQRRF